MADTSLDDFFAKKDKSKKKSKSKIKYTTTDTIAKNLEDGGKKIEKVVKKEKEKNVPSVVGLSSTSTTSSNISQQAAEDVTVSILEENDEEWHEFEEKEKDYSGLKVQALSLVEKEKEEEQNKENSSQEGGETERNTDCQSGPWKLSTSNSLESPQPQVVEEPKTSGGAYRPPHMRNTAAAVTPSKRNPKSAPDVGSELHFPSLSAAVDASKAGMSEQKWGEKQFQSVKHGLKSKDDVRSSAPQLDLENKYAALHQDLN